MKGFPDIPPIWWVASIALIHAFGWVAPGLHAEIAILEFLSRVIFAAALALIMWSAIWFWRKKTPIEPHHTPKALIVEGPYKVSRNPIYLALVMLTTASALGAGSVFGLFVTLALWRVLDARFAAIEEELLKETFGGEAEAYLAKTRRWI